MQPFWNNKGNNRILPFRFNAVCICGACLRWLLPELSIPTAGQKDRRLWERDCKKIGHHACLRGNELLFRCRALLVGNLLRRARARAYLRALMMRKLCAVGMRNTILRNNLNFYLPGKLKTLCNKSRNILATQTAFNVCRLCGSIRPAKLTNHNSCSNWGIFNNYSPKWRWIAQVIRSLTNQSAREFNTIHCFSIYQNKLPVRVCSRMWYEIDIRLADVLKRFFVASWQSRFKTNHNLLTFINLRQSFSSSRSAHASWIHLFIIIAD